MNATALVAEDEPLLAANLQAELAQLWPDLRIVANVRHGAAAVEQALALQPDVIFLDIRMPGMTGLEAAEAITEDWPEKIPLPLLVFVTAYEQHAMQAFERAAIDYVLKPVRPERLAQTCIRLQAGLRARYTPATVPTLDDTLARLRELLAIPGIHNGGSSVPRLAVIRAGVGPAIHMVPVGEVLYFEAADKYVRVVTAERDHLIRTSLRELLPQLDPHRFWQIHRGTVVRSDAIATALREESGKVQITLRGHADKLVASRLYGHLFRPM